MLYRVFNDIFDIGRLVAVTEMQQTAAWRKFAIILANSGQTHKYEGRMHTSEGVAVANAHRELMDYWKLYDRDLRTWAYRRTESSLIYKLRNFHISLRAVTAIEGIATTDTDAGTEQSFKVWFEGRTEPVVVAVPANDTGKLERLRADCAALCQAWEEAMPAIVSYRTRAHGG
jgi:hypothetical protein